MSLYNVNNSLTPEQRALLAMNINQYEQISNHIDILFEMLEEVKQNIHCKLCAPNNKQLYYPLLNKDMKLPNNCQELKNIKTKVKTIDFDGKTYYYKSENKNIDIFEFNENFGKYIRMKQSDPIYPILFDKILNL